MNVPSRQQTVDGAQLSTLHLRGIRSSSCQGLRRQTCQGTSLVTAWRRPLEKQPLIHSSLGDLPDTFTGLTGASCSYGTWSNQSWSLIRIGLWACGEGGVVGLLFEVKPLRINPKKPSKRVGKNPASGS